ncbi:glucose 1-dehydrogenase [Compostibacter hankyongensis]|uniref:SDR family oxidoreductase n=1 Tax=Compostibacter hankyongensis TaxID=1007089 RepID=A0ABP8FPM1_9BACT
MSWNLKDKKAVVTGSSKGIGKAIAAELLSLGAEVLLTARNENELKSTQTEFASQGFRVHALPGNVSDEGHRTSIATWVEQHWERLDVLVNNAGINIRKPSATYSASEYAQVMDTNLFAPFELSRLLFVPLQKSGRGAVINIASVAGSFDAQTGAPYGMSKAGMLQMTRSLAREWADAGIRVNSVSPWFTETPLTRDLLSQPEKRSVIEKRTPAGRVAKDKEVAAAVAFLALDEASFITGQNLSVDGGATAGML